MLTLTKVLLLTCCVSGCATWKQGDTLLSERCTTNVFLRSPRNALISRKLSVTCSTSRRIPQDYLSQWKRNYKGDIGNDIP